MFGVTSPRSTSAAADDAPARLATTASTHAMPRAEILKCAMPMPPVRPIRGEQPPEHGPLRVHHTPRGMMRGGLQLSHAQNLLIAVRDRARVGRSGEPRSLGGGAAPP